MIRLHDTASGEIRELTLREPGKVGMYVCGPTVYGPPHLGHGRFSLVFDVLRRYLESTGLDVCYVSNVTDIDDKIIERANREHRGAQEIADKCEAIWWRAMDAIGVKRPTRDPHATAYVSQMVDLVERLVAAERAYVTDDGVYLSVRSVPDYGLLAHQSLDEMLVGGGERELVGAEHKRDTGDFALWKLAKLGEPSWPSPWGAGRPGWHTECVVMALDLLGEGFDLHGGGQDLAFPHHENERAQAVALGRRFARHWVHNGFVVDPSGEKMSKSLGNFANLLDLVEEVDPRSYRLLVLQAHYRSPLTVDRATIGRAVRSLESLDAFARRAASSAAVEAAPDVVAAFRERMNDDLDTPAAMALVFDTVRRANALLDQDEALEAAPFVAAVHEMCAAVGLVLRSRGTLPADVIERLAELDAARATKDFATADALRDQLRDLGWVVETTKDGSSAHRAGVDPGFDSGSANL